MGIKSIPDPEPFPTIRFPPPPPPTLPAKPKLPIVTPVEHVQPKVEPRVEAVPADKPSEAKADKTWTDSVTGWLKKKAKEEINRRLDDDK